MTNLTNIIILQINKYNNMFNMYIHNFINWMLIFYFDSKKLTKMIYKKISTL